MNWLRDKLARWLGFSQAIWNANTITKIAELLTENAALAERITDLEKHFVTGKNETLADLSLEERKARRQLQGATPFQRRTILAARERLPNGPKTGATQ